MALFAAPIRHGGGADDRDDTLAPGKHVVTCR
jgi:hypothetical protein